MDGHGLRKRPRGAPAPPPPISPNPRPFRPLPSLPLTQSHPSTTITPLSHNRTPLPQSHTPTTITPLSHNHTPLTQSQPAPFAHPPLQQFSRSPLPPLAPPCTCIRVTSSSPVSSLADLCSASVVRRMARALLAVAFRAMDMAWKEQAHEGHGRGRGEEMRAVACVTGAVA